ncbi:MAG: squalene--hopene cyclase [Planctomycetes bacterium]|nr:squalene--hopene cyclase [Planctomycetota bacterium]
MDHCRSRALKALRAKRHADGYWEGRLATSPLATAVALAALAHEPTAPIDRSAAAEYLRRTQHPDGGWGDTDRSKSNLAATLLVLSADALQSERFRARDASSSTRQGPSGMLPEEARERAERFVESLGGLRHGLARIYGRDLTFQVPIRMAAASAGLLDWREVDPLPFELTLVPRSVMGAIGLPVVSYALPALVCVGLSRHAQAPSGWPHARALRAWSAARALKLTASMQPKSGGFLEAIPITAFCLLGLHAAGRSEHQVARNATRFLAATQRADGGWPVEVHLATWNTTRAIDALHGAGLLEEALDASERVKTRDWLLACQKKSPHPYTGTAPGGWGWNALDGAVPDADDTAGALLALRALGVPAQAPQLQAGLRWLLTLQNRDGGIPTFCRGWQRLPFDQSAPDLTAHALRAMQALETAEHPAYAKAWRCLERVQRPDGSFAPLWFGCEAASDELNATYGTAQVLLACAHEKAPMPLRDRALAWLRSIQHEDGAFGGTSGAPGSAEETGLALRAMAAHQDGRADPACSRAARWLIEHQREDGSWDPSPIGFYFAVLWYYEELYPLCFALGGLGTNKAGGLASARQPEMIASNGQ